MNAFTCDGCHETYEGSPALTISNTSGVTMLELNDEHHACSWSCVQAIALARVDTQSFVGAQRGPESSSITGSVVAALHEAALTLVERAQPHDAIDDHVRRVFVQRLAVAVEATEPLFSSYLSEGEIVCHRHIHPAAYARGEFTKLAEREPCTYCLEQS